MAPKKPTSAAYPRFFWNGRQKRPRTLWRLLGQLVMFLFFLLAGGLVVDILGSGPGGEQAVILAGGIAIASVIISILVAVRWLDRRVAVDLGFHISADWWRQFGFGLVLGALLITLVFAVEWLAGWVRVVDVWVVVDGQTPFLLAIWRPMILFLLVGFYEELFFRGYLLRNLAEGFYGGPISPAAAIWLAVLLTSGLFGLLHLVNPNATWISSLNLGLAGIMMALGYIWTGELALPIGLHVTWNFFQGNVFGFPVSGVPLIGGTVLGIEQAGPALLTGGAFGPEAGLIGVAAIFLGCALIWGWTRRRVGPVAVQTALAVYRPQSGLEVGADRPEVGEEGV